MIGFYSLQSICHEYFSQNLNIDSLTTLIDLLAKIKLRFITLKNVQKFIILSVIVKCRWIHRCLKIITVNIDSLIKSANNQIIMNKIAFKIRSDIAFVLKHLQSPFHNNKSATEEIYNKTVSELCRQLEVIDSVITKGGGLYWSLYLDKLDNSISVFIATLDDFKSSHLNELIIGNVQNEKNDSLEIIRKLKVECSTHTEITPLITSSLKDVKRRFLLMAGEESEILNEAIVEEIQEDFKGYYVFKCLIYELLSPPQFTENDENVIKESLEYSEDGQERHGCITDINGTSLYSKRSSPSFSTDKTCESIERKVLAEVPLMLNLTNKNTSQDSTTQQASSEKSVTGFNGDVTVVCSTPRKNRVLQSTQFICPIDSVEVITEKDKITPKRNVSLSPDDIVQWPKANKNKRLRKNVDSDEGSIITTMSKGRSQWNFQESIFIYKGVREGLTWIEIKNKYFLKSFRSNVNIKDRWRTMQTKPEFMETLKESVEQKKQSVTKEES